MHRLGLHELDVVGERHGGGADVTAAQKRVERRVTAAVGQRVGQAARAFEARFDLYFRLAAHEVEDSLDNGPGDAETLGQLRQRQRAGAVHVLRREIGEQPLIESGRGKILRARRQRREPKLLRELRDVCGCRRMNCQAH
jgi:hypothetical protein